ncbi:hypothetical protein FQR65_LT19563 [Abscondita terminalis]|nr:hypothetical protein FQR65_LT19563 [Abscondita terminalis]
MESFELHLQEGEQVFTLKVNEQDYVRAHKDMKFAQMLLEHAQTMKRAQLIMEDQTENLENSQAGNIIQDSLEEMENTTNGGECTSTWEYNETLALIRAMENHLDEINHANPRKRKNAWSSISNDLESFKFMVSILEDL